MLSSLKFLTVTFIIKILSQSIHKYARGKYGTENLRRCRGYEKLLTKLEKTNMDIKFLHECKKKGITPMFARPKLSLQGDNSRLSNKIGILILKEELRRKYKTQRNLKIKIRNSIIEIERETSQIFAYALQYRTRCVVYTKKQKWLATHRRKLENLQRNGSNPRRPSAPTPNVVHNFSQYDLTEEERKIFAYS